MEKVALLVPTKDRLKFVIRLINYYASINSQHPIFIGDASGKSYKEEILKASNGKLEIYYFHWKNLNERKTTRKLAEQVHLASISDYCVFNPDDDFFVLESLSMCAEFLSKNPEYSTSQGRAFLFELETNDAYGELKDIGIYWDVKELNGETAMERIRELVSNYWVPLFSVHRTQEFIDDTSNGIDEVLDRAFGEYANNLSFAMRGKSKFIDCLYLARSTHRHRNPPRNIDWITKDNWYLSYIGLINSMSKLLSKNDNLSLAESNIQIKLLLNKLLQGNYDDNYSTKSFMLRKYSEFISTGGFVYMLSRLYRIIRLSSIFPCKGFSKKCLMSSKSDYSKDVSYIINSCKKKNIVS